MVCGDIRRYVIMLVIINIFVKKLSMGVIGKRGVIFCDVLIKN
jgi:hypothetical protein